MIEADDPFCLPPHAASALLHRHPWKRFAVLGDSVAQGIGDPVAGYSGLPWCDRIAAELRAQEPALEYLNLGARDLFAAQVRATQLAPALAFQPDLALVVCGGNDAMRSSYDADAVDRELTAMIIALRGAGSAVVTVSVFDIAHAPAFPGRVREVVSARMLRFAAHTAALAEKLGTIHVHCTGHPAERDPASYSADGLHANMRGHQICAAIAVRRLGLHLGNLPDGGD